MNQCWVPTVERLAELDRQQAFEQLSVGAPQAVAPALLPLLKMHGLQGLFNSLMGGKASPFVVTRLRAQDGLGQIRLGLMQPIRRTIHGAILNRLQPPRRSASTRGS